MGTTASSSGHRRALTLLLLIGAGLRLWQFLGNASLWLDEIAIAENIRRLSYGALVSGPLDLAQIAPPGFLLAEKASAALFGLSEPALRLFPLLCSLIALWLFARLAERVLEGWTSLFATGFFALGAPMIFHGAEVKQYSSDVAISILLTLLALGLRDPEASSTRFLHAGIVGAAAVWLSQTATLMLAGLGIALAAAALARREKAATRNLAWALIPWAASSGAATIASLARVTPDTRAYMLRFWQEGFPPPPGAHLARWLLRSLAGFWTHLEFRAALPMLYVFLALLGFLSLWRRRRDAALLLGAPVVVTLTAAAAREYPFSGRLIFFLAPAFLIAAGEGAGVTATWLAGIRVPAAATAGILALPQVLAILLNPPVYRPEDTKPAIAYLARHRKAREPIYVYYGAGPAFGWYGPRYRLDPADAVFGGCHRGDLRAYLREIDRLRGRPRVWVLFAHSLAGLREEQTILAYLDRIGRGRARLRLPDDDPNGVTAALYDLSIPERLDAASADTFPVPGRNEEALRHFGCGFGPLTWRGDSAS